MGNNFIRKRVCVFGRISVTGHTKEIVFFEVRSKASIKAPSPISYSQYESPRQPAKFPLYLHAHF